MKTNDIEESNKSTRFRTKCDNIVWFLNYSIPNEYLFVIEYNCNRIKISKNRIFKASNPKESNRNHNKGFDFEPTLSAA